MRITVNCIRAVFPCKYACSEGRRGAVRTGIRLCHVFLIWNVGGWLASWVSQPISLNCGLSYVPKSVRWKALAVNGFSLEYYFIFGKISFYSGRLTSFFLNKLMGWKETAMIVIFGSSLEHINRMTKYLGCWIRRMTWIWLLGETLHMLIKFCQKACRGKTIL